MVLRRQPSLMTRIYDNDYTVFDVETTLDTLNTSENELASLVGDKLHETPSWFSYPEACYRDSLLRLPARVLISSARRYVRGTTNIRTKGNAVEELLDQFLKMRLELSSLSDDVMFVHLSRVLLPHGCVRSRSAVMAAHLCDSFGEQVAAAVCTPPPIATDIAASDHTSSWVVPWMSCPIEDLIRELCKLTREDIISCVRQLAPNFRSLIDTRSHKKSCNGLANVLHLSMLQLIEGGARMVADVVIALLPFLDVSAMRDADVFNRILSLEFGDVVVD